MSSMDPFQGAETPSIDPMMMDLFKVELETQTKALSTGLLEVEKQGEQYQEFEPLMRAAHSIKGAGRIVRMEPVIQLAHCMEDCFVAAQKGGIAFSPELVDTLLSATDAFVKLSKIPPATMAAWLSQQCKEWRGLCNIIRQAVRGESLPEKSREGGEVVVPEGKAAPPPSRPHALSEERVLRVTAQNLNRLMGLAGEALVESRWLEPFAETLTHIKNQHNKLADFLKLFRCSFDERVSREKLSYYLEETIRLEDECREGLTARLADLDLFIVRNSQLSARLYGEVVDSRMRPFSDCLEGFPRMVRDLAKLLNKKVHLEILGKNTPVDRDILEKLESPLGHLLRNAVDHGIEPPDVRTAIGKPPEGKIILEAQHRGGMLLIMVSDDGRGVDLEHLRHHLVEKQLAKEEMVQQLTEGELLDFLLLPGFSTADQLTDVSGRGVGLNVVQNMIQEVAGTLKIVQEKGKGTAFYLQLPLTLSVIRALIAEVGGDPYAFPLSRIDRVLELPKSAIETVEGRQYFRFEGENIGLVSARQVLEVGDGGRKDGDFSVVVFSDRHNAYGVIVDKLIGQREFVVQELDPRLKKVQDIYAGALMEDGTPVLILDVEDMVRSIDRLLSLGRPQLVQQEVEKTALKRRKRILVVDDSITVREVEARLLRNHGYEVEMAVNGVDGWNAIRVGKYDLVVTDVDMPRMNGIELVRTIRADANLKDLPVLIVSYKEREEDRILGMEAGANYYLTKSSFHDEALLSAVIDLIGA